MAIGYDHDGTIGAATASRTAPIEVTVSCPSPANVVTTCTAMSKLVTTGYVSSISGYRISTDPLGLLCQRGRREGNTTKYLAFGVWLTEATIPVSLMSHLRRVRRNGGRGGCRG